jgi:DNA-binding TFAR19-related protein (PDSD5 family)
MASHLGVHPVRPKDSPWALWKLGGCGLVLAFVFIPAALGAPPEILKRAKDDLADNKEVSATQRGMAAILLADEAISLIRENLRAVPPNRKAADYESMESIIYTKTAKSFLTEIKKESPEIAKKIEAQIKDLETATNKLTPDLDEEFMFKLRRYVDPLWAGPGKNW